MNQENNFDKMSNRLKELLAQINDPVTAPKDTKRAEAILAKIRARHEVDEND